MPGAGFAVLRSVVSRREESTAAAAGQSGRSVGATATGRRKRSRFVMTRFTHNKLRQRTSLPPRRRERRQDGSFRVGGTCSSPTGRRARSAAAFCWLALRNRWLDGFIPLNHRRDRRPRRIMLNHPRRASRWTDTRTVLLQWIARTVL